MNEDEDIVVIDESENVTVEQVSPKKKPTPKTRKKRVIITEDKPKEEVPASKPEEPVETVPPQTVPQVDCEPVKTVPFEEKLYNLQNDMTDMAKDFVKDGYNSGQKYEYVKAQQYKTMLRKCLAQNRLRGKLDDMMSTLNDVLKVDKMLLTQYHGMYTIKDVDSDRQETYMIWSQGSDSLDKGLSKAKTLAIKDFIKSNFLISDNEDDVECDAPKSPTENVGTMKKVKFVKPSESAKLVEEVMSNSSKATDSEKAEIKRRILAIREASKNTSYGEKTLANVDNMTSTEASVTLTKLETKGYEYDLDFNEGGK